MKGRWESSLQIEAIRGHRTCGWWLVGWRAGYGSMFTQPHLPSALRSLPAATVS